MIKKSLHSLSNQIKTFWNFLLTIFKILCLINGKNFLPNLKTERWALVSAIK